MWPFSRKRSRLTAADCAPTVEPWLKILARIENGVLVVALAEHDEVFRRASPWPIPSAEPEWLAVAEQVQIAARTLAGERHWRSMGERYTLRLIVKRDQAEALVSWGRRSSEWGFSWPTDPKGACGPQFDALERLRDAIMVVACRELPAQADKLVAYG